MAAKEFAEYKYEAGLESSKGIINFFIIAPIPMLVFIGINYQPLVLFLIIIPLVIFFMNLRSSSPNIVLVGARYLIVGGSVVYYANIAEVSEDRDRGVLTILTDQGRTVKIISNKFPTGARKPAKIKKNRDAKFMKTAEKIVSRIREISPHALKGLSS